MRCRDPAAPWRGRPPDGGAGAVLVLGVVAVTLALLAALLPLGTVAVARHRAAAAADAAALAAAATIAGLADGDPCVRAAEVAEGGGAELERCVPDGLIVTVRVAVPAGPLRVQVDATAGPAG